MTEAAWNDLADGLAGTLKTTPEPPRRGTRPDVKSDVRKRTPHVLDMADIDMTPPKMLVRGWIPSGAITILAGRPGAGKGVAMADIIARGSRGDVMPNRDRIVGPFKSRIVCGPGEDGAADWKLRLVAAGANLAHCTTVEHAVDDLGDLTAISAGDLGDILERAAKDGVRLVVVDSLSAVGEGLNLDKPDVRLLLNPLANRARLLDLSVVVIHHVRKSGGDVQEIVSGSVQIVAAARSVLVVVNERESEDETRFLWNAKLNGSRRSDPVAFTTAGRSVCDDHGNELRDDRGDRVYVPVVAWSDRKVTEAEVNAAANNEALGNDELSDVIRDALAGGPLRSSELEAEVTAAGFSRDQLKRSRQRLGCGVVKVGHGDLAGWWTLPPGMPKEEGKAWIEQQCATV